MIRALVRLRAQRIHRRALAEIEHAHLDRRLVRDNPHHAAQRVNLAHQMTLPRAADGRIARHHRDIVQRNRRQKRPAAEMRRSQRRLAPRMPRADHNHIIRIDEHHKNILPYPFLIFSYYRGNGGICKRNGVWSACSALGVTRKIVIRY